LLIIRSKSEPFPSHVDFYLLLFFDIVIYVFQIAFQEPAKRLDALMFCANEVLMHIDALIKFSPHTIADKSTPIEESTKIYEQVSYFCFRKISAISRKQDVFNYVWKIRPFNSSMSKLMHIYVFVFMYMPQLEGSV
jgi:hypothetical protein